jgi:hypothetical protein
VVEVPAETIMQMEAPSILAVAEAVMEMLMVALVAMVY